MHGLFLQNTVILHKRQVWQKFCIMPCCKFNKLYFCQILSR